MEPLLGEGERGIKKVLSYCISAEMTANLDALLDMLDAEVSDDEEADGGEQQKNVNQSEIDEDVIAGLDEVLFLRSGTRSGF